MQVRHFYAFCSCSSPGLLQESLGPFGPKVSRECPSCLSGALRAPGSDLFDTPGTLSGHFLDTPEPGARRAPETPRENTLGTLRARDSCSRPLQFYSVFKWLQRFQNVLFLVSCLAIPSGGLRARGSGETRKCPWSIKKVSRRLW